MLVSSLLGTVGIPVKIHPVLNLHAELFGFGKGVDSGMSAVHSTNDTRLFEHGLYLAFAV